jgi:hypothetical protein
MFKTLTRQERYKKKKKNCYARMTFFSLLIPEGESRRTVYYYKKGKARRWGYAHPAYHPYFYRA